jgi:hypothetical protein
MTLGMLHKARVCGLAATLALAGTGQVALGQEAPAPRQEDPPPAQVMEPPPPSPLPAPSQPAPGQPPRQALPPPAEVKPVPQPDGATDDEEQPELEPGDPRPEVQGGAMIVCGWIGFGIGTTALFGAYTSSSNANGLTQPTDEKTYVIYGGLAAAGLGLALFGHMRRADSKARLEEWEQRHGVQPESSWKRAVPAEVQWTLAPVLGAVQGVAWGLVF